MRFHHTAIATLTLLAGGSATAVTALSSTAPDSYNMLNGDSGSFTYFDDSYNGVGCVTCSYAPLSGGKGDLTDGLIATGNWFAASGPYVGWRIDPVITFHWATPVNITSVTFHFDDSDGSGGVNAPASVLVDGNLFSIDEPAGSAPFAFAAGIMFSGTELSVTVNRRGEWVFLSEVEFNAVAVPEPQTYALMLAGLAAVGAVVRRKRAG